MSNSVVPRWFWVVAVLALVWNAMGAASYLQHVTMGADALAAMEDAERALFENVPPWATGAYAMAVWAGVIASILLLMRRSVATVVYMVSLLGILVQFSHAFFMTDMIEVYGATSVIMPLLILLFGVLLVWHARRCVASGWLN